MVVGSCGIFCMKGAADMARRKDYVVKERLNEQEKLEWDELYKYVRGNVMGYDETMMLPSWIVLRLRGLRHGKFYDNNKTKNYAKYPFSTILYTFKVCMPEIKYILDNKHFNNEQRKFNYIMKIVEGKLNDVTLRLKAAQKAEEQLQEAAPQQEKEYVNRFKAKESKVNHRLDDLW